MPGQAQTMNAECEQRSASTNTARENAHARQRARTHTRTQSGQPCPRATSVPRAPWQNAFQHGAKLASLRNLQHAGNKSYLISHTIYTHSFNDFLRVHREQAIKYFCNAGSRWRVGIRGANLLADELVASDMLNESCEWPTCWPN